jgi:LysM repeat protein
VRLDQGLIARSAGAGRETTFRFLVAGEACSIGILAPMTVPADLPGSNALPSRSHSDPRGDRATPGEGPVGRTPHPAEAVCPYLLSAGGAWRSLTAGREHRCVALDPPAAQSSEKQQRHCLSAAHSDCPIFVAARTARLASLTGGVNPGSITAAEQGRRPIPRTAPVLLEPPRLVDQAIRLQLDRTPGQLALVALMIVAFAVVALSRMSGTSEPAATGPSATIPAATVPPSKAPPTSTPTPVVTPSAPSSASPSGTPSRPNQTSYAVKKGDTLISIASKFGTTTAAIRAANGLKTSTIRVGQVLKIP